MKNKSSIKNYNYRQLIALVFLIPVFSFGQDSYVTYSETEGSFELASASELPNIYVDSDDFKGVHHVAEDFTQDIERVTGKLPELNISGEINAETAVIVGTLGKSRLIDHLAGSGKLDVSELTGKWETYTIQVVENPMPNVERALVIAGSDKRGTIFGMYDVSEEIGVSPWYWWADVPANKAENLYIKAGKYTDGSPKVKYRGIFINDEAPALSGWATENFGGFNSQFYEHVFELILRLKGNYLWPAMWGRAFYDDDPKNPIIANEYGVVIGTSHHEPLMRAHVEWSRYGEGDWNYNTNPENLQQFWREGMERMGDNESVVTIGMRGDGDEPMSEGTAIDLLENVVEDQRRIIAEVTGKPAEETPQVWALYKEVQDYYDQGMRVPDDVTLLLADDNWGNIRKLPNPEEEEREGGYGIYYHFDYVGGPRNYKWINTTQISRVWEQMNLAYKFGAEELWIVNVGDIKPMEFPTSFFLDYAWDPERITAEDLPKYTRKWAEKQFGEEYAEETANILEKYTKYNSRRKPELLSAETYSITSYNEAERVLEDFSKIEEQAEQIYDKLPQRYRDAFYQLVLFPVKASANLNRLYVATAKNRLYAKQGRAIANNYANDVEQYYEKDAELTEYYHNELADGKWNHMMSQNHIGYTYWQQPEEQSMPEVQRLEVPEEAAMGIAVEGSTNSWPTTAAKGQEAVLPIFDPYNDQTYYIDIFNKGQEKFKYKIKNKEDWIELSSEKGKVDQQERIYVSVNWDEAPEGEHEVALTIKGPKKTKVEVLVSIRNPSEEAKGFLENNGYVSIPANEYSEKTNGNNEWQLIPNLGKTGSAMSSGKIKPGREFSENNPSLNYDFYTFSSGEVEVEFTLSPSLDFLDRGGLRFAVSIDGKEPKILNLQEDTEDNWDTSVANNATTVTTSFNLENDGAHNIKIWAIDPGIVLQKILIKTGEVEDSYLGPPMSAKAE
ncbi:glycosyl hydrolase 115 family protein [Autumnicola psychrophila]|uniref:Glycosyl hydrolase 115 family protein n=1 Tax=Autumnicola psychrophila TaxID=3075592 RepID=A0ABU3DNP6_9FLAO|nr:glycosyl hydrolase 115 family protein [Zunongwangia sp. F225]MDT0685331.1 glycosyl hydrolase 115 family protein [Zunongwangia sp. F225]